MDCYCVQKNLQQFDVFNAKIMSEEKEKINYIDINGFVWANKTANYFPKVIFLFSFFPIKLLWPSVFFSCAIHLLIKNFSRASFIRIVLSIQKHSLKSFEVFFSPFLPSQKKPFSENSSKSTLPLEKQFKADD